LNDFYEGLTFSLPSKGWNAGAFATAFRECLLTLILFLADPEIVE